MPKPSSGQPVLPPQSPTTTSTPDLLAFLESFRRKHPGWFWAIAIVLILSGVVTWPLLIGLTLVWIGQGVWKLAERQNPPL